MIDKFELQFLKSLFIYTHPIFHPTKSSGERPPRTVKDFNKTYEETFYPKMLNPVVNAGSAGIEVDSSNYETVRPVRPTTTTTTTTKLPENQPDEFQSEKAREAFISPGLSAGWSRPSNWRVIW